MSPFGIEKIFGPNKQEIESQAKFEFSNDDEKRVFNEFIGANKLKALIQFLNNDEVGFFLALKSSKLKDVAMSKGLIRDIKRVFELEDNGGSDYQFTITRLTDEQKQQVQEFVEEASIPTTNTII